MIIYGNDRVVICKKISSSRRSVITLCTNRIVIWWRYTSTHVLTFKWWLQFRHPLTLTSLSHLIGSLRFRLHLTIEERLKTFKCYHDHCYIVQCFLVERQFHDVFYSFPTKFMKSVKRPFVSSESVPNYLYNLSIRQFIINSIT